MGRIDSNKLQPVFQLSPQLCKINLVGFSMNVLSVLSQHFPNLEILNVNNAHFNSSRFEDRILKPIPLQRKDDDDHHNDGHGQRFLVLHSIFTLDPGIPMLLQKYQSTIERFQLYGLVYFTGGRSSISNHDWRFFSR